MKANNFVHKAKTGFSRYTKCVHKVVTMINKPVKRENNRISNKRLYKLVAVTYIPLGKIYMAFTRIILIV